MKALCFLHHRDSPDAKHHDYNSIMRGKDPLTWRDLQLVLRHPHDSMLAILESFECKGRVTAEQVDFSAAAIAFLKRDREQNSLEIGGESLEPSIYHLVWKWGWMEDRGFIFRGQRSSHWRQETSLLRPQKDGVPTDLGTLVMRLSQTQAFLDTLREREQELFGLALEEDEHLAVAQHYGLPTPLLDYTRSLGVAAEHLSVWRQSIRDWARFRIVVIPGRGRSPEAMHTGLRLSCQSWCSWLPGLALTAVLE